MEIYFSCFEKVIMVLLPSSNNNVDLIFWVERFCPGVKKINSKQEPDLLLECISNTYSDVILESKRHIKLIHLWNDDYSSYLGKFIAQLFQKLLIDKQIFFLPASCVVTKNGAVLILGDFGQGKTSVALNTTLLYPQFHLLSDNYVAVQNNFIIGSTKYISIRQENVSMIKTIKNVKLFNFNSRLFFESPSFINKTFKIKGLIVPFINSSDDNTHFVSKEESIWYLYQKFSRLISGEVVLFNGKLPSPIFNNDFFASKILSNVNLILKSTKLVYSSSKINTISKNIMLMLMGDSI